MICCFGFLNYKNILITGSSGFIGYHLSLKLIEMGLNIIGYDNLNSYYDQTLKNRRLEIIQKFSENHGKNWNFIKGDLSNKDLLEETFKKYKPDIVINLAAQAGVRYSIKNPHIYVNSNITGFANILECCRIFQIKNFLYASSSSVYGGNTKTPFSEKDSVNHPISMYAATKKANELMAHTYSHLYDIPCTGMRFFTVYGPWGRPDMSPMIFTKAIFAEEPINIFNNGDMSRSFTYIQDIIAIILKLINKPALKDDSFDKKSPNPSTSWCRHKIFNLGNEKSINLMDFINLLELEIGKKAIRKYERIQPGDVQHTAADCSSLKDWIGETPQTSIEDGIKSFIKWYKDFYDH